MKVKPFCNCITIRWWWHDTHRVVNTKLSSRESIPPLGEITTEKSRKTIEVQQQCPCRDYILAHHRTIHLYQSTHDALEWHVKLIAHFFLPVHKINFHPATHPGEKQTNDCCVCIWIFEGEMTWHWYNQFYPSLERSVIANGICIFNNKPYCKPPSAVAKKMARPHHQWLIVHYIVDLRVYRIVMPISIIDDKWLKMLCKH